MKFCKKCHKMCVSKVTNPNNLYRICGCDDNEVKYVARAVACRLKADMSASMSDPIMRVKFKGCLNRKDCWKIFDDMEKQIAYTKQ